MKKIVSCIAFVLLTLLLVFAVTDVLMPKALNRYYILGKYLEENPEHYLHDVQVFGSCHSYTSFNPVYLEEISGESAFVYGNAGEIIPTTYVRMSDQFRRHLPKVALVEIWGINPYETYDTEENIFGDYLANNLESLPFSLEKQEVIRDFSHMTYQDIGFLSMNFPIVTYKDRVLDKSLTDSDFHYSFEGTRPYSDDYTYYEMESRLYNNGFKANPSKSIVDYPEKQSVIGEGDRLDIEEDIVKYVYKIIELCREKEVPLIFYRAPYRSSENELKKLTHLKEICEENDVLFLDLEEEIEFDYEVDFLDYEHLSECGANRATAYLAPYILEAMGSEAKLSLPVRENLISQTWTRAFEEDAYSLTERGSKFVSGSSSSGFRVYQTLDTVESLRGRVLLARFAAAEVQSSNLAFQISCFDAEGEELSRASAFPTEGEVLLSLSVPPNTASICVGIFSDWYLEGGPQVGETLILESAALYQA